MSQILIFTKNQAPWQAAIGAFGFDVEIRDLYGSPKTSAPVVFVDVRDGRIGAGLLSVLEQASVAAVLSGQPWTSRRRTYRDQPFQSERFGSLIIHHGVLSVSDAPSGCERPVVTHGPGIRGDHGRPVLWATSPFEGLGVPVARDDASVISYMYDAIQGHRPLWFQPGFPALLPPAPVAFRALDGSRVEGALCSSIDRPGGWVVLRLEEVKQLLGYQDLPVENWATLTKVIPVHAAHALLAWLSLCSQRLGSSAPASSVSGVLPGFPVLT